MLNNEAAANSIQVVFGTLDHGDLFNVVPFGEYAADANPNIPNLSYDSSLRYSESEEEPFLALRLFQLGLRGWAIKQSQPALDVRNRLRQWEFEYDDIPGGLDFMGQGFALLDNYAITGKDIVVLKAVGPNELEFIFNNQDRSNSK